MENVLDKNCSEYESTHFMFNNFFPENRTVYAIMPKNMVETKGPQITSKYGAYALHSGLARLHERMHMHTPPRPGTHARTHAKARTHRPISNTSCFSTATMVSLQMADDLVLLAKEETVLEGIIDRIIETGRCYGMEMNVEKTKVMRI